MNFWKDYRSFNEAMKALDKMRPDPSVSDLMQDQIAIAIAKMSVATAFEVHEAYDRLGSWDEVIVAAEKTCEGWSMFVAVGDILKTRLADRIDEAGRKGAKAGILLREIAVACMKLADESDGE